MFRPARFEDAIQVLGVQPFDPDRIPLVLVHGLASTAESWLPFVNLLLEDPVVREQYQIFLFNYPNGNPISRSAADLREGLADLREDYDPKGEIPKMRRMVIVGHSMGGIISNMQIRDAGDALFRQAFTRDLEELGLEGESEAALRRAYFFEANPDIDRAILMAAPFRGSAFASNKIGQLGAWLIRAPFDLVDTLFGQIEFIDAMTDVAQEASQRPQNSVSSLRPDNPLLHNVLELPVRPGVDIHTIIARWRTRVPVEESSDGVVTYASAHLDEAVSEKIIDGYNHRRQSKLYGFFNNGR